MSPFETGLEGSIRSSKTLPLSPDELVFTAPDPKSLITRLRESDEKKSFHNLHKSA
jgi:hypothetical protein